MTNFIKKAALGLLALSLVVAFASKTNAAFTFNTNLKMGMTSTDVAQLQMVLNATPATMVSATGAGSPGHESNYFGAKTLAAVKAYQSAHGISPVSGYVGPLTRASINSGSGSNNNNGNSNNNTSGPVSVMLSQDNPASNVVVSGQATADLAHFTFTGSGTVNTLTLQRSGVSSNTSLSNVYLYQGATRITEAASVNSYGVITFNGVNLAVNGSTTVSVKADIATSLTGGTVGVTLTGYTVSGSSSAMTANLAGNIMSITAGGSGVIAQVIVDNGASSPYNNVAAATINAGATSYTVWSTPIQVNTHTVWLKSLALRYVGSAPNDALSNITLYLNGVPTGSTSTVNSMGYVVFDLSAHPVLINTGSTTIDVRGDVQKGSNRSFQFSLQNAADLMVTDSQLNVNVAPTTASTTSFLISQAGLITISTGSATTVITPSFQAMTNVTGGSTNAVIGRFTLHAYGEDVKVNTLSVTPNVASAVASGSVDTNSLNNVALYFNGAQVGSSTNWTSGAITYNLGSSMIIPAGVDSTLEVRADVQTSDNYNLTSGTITTTLNIGSSNGQGMTSLNTTNFPLAAISTTGLTIATGSLSVGSNPAYANQTINPNVTNQKIASFVLQNQSSSESVRVTNLAVAMALTSVGSTNYSNLYTSETSGSGSTPINPATAAASATSTNNFSVLFTLAPGATKTIDVFATIGAGTGSFSTTLLPTAVGVSSNVNVTPSAAVTGQTITIGTGTFNAPTFVTGSSTVSQFVAAAGGLTDGTDAAFKFTATSGTATVSELKFSITGTNTVGSLRIGNQTANVQVTPATTLNGAIVTAATSAVVTSATGLSVGQILTIGSEQVQITAISGTTITITRAVNSTTADAYSNGATVTPKGIAYFTGLNIAVPNGSSGSTIHVFPTYSSVGANGISSNTSATVQMVYEQHSIGGTTTPQAITPISAPTMQVVGSKPIITAAHPTTTLAAGAIEAIDITVAADSHGDITLNSLPITVTMNAATVSTTATTNIVVKDANNATIATTNTAFAATTGGATVISFTTPYLIQGGTSQTFKIFVTVVAVTGTGVNGASMATSPTASSGFGWQDTAGNSTSIITNTTYIPSYPSTFTSVIYN